MSKLYKIKPEQGSEIIKLYSSGRSLKELGRNFKVKHATIKRYLQENNVKIREYFKKIDKQQLLEIINLYKSGLSVRNVAKQCNLSDGCIRTILKNNRINKRSRSEYRIYTLNDNFFEKIDTEEKAYFLGLLYADGCNSYPKKNQITISLQEEDGYILERFKKALQSNAPLHLRKKKVERHKDQTCFYFNSKKLCQDLHNLGCVAAKSLTVKFPTNEQVPNHLMNHFLRGVNDGDGNFYRTGKRHCRITILSSIDFIKDCCAFVIKAVDISVRNRLRSSIAAAEISGAINVSKFIQWLYKDATIYLKRKEIQAKEFLNYFKDYKTKFTSQYLGVSLSKSNTYIVNCYYNRENIYLGSYNNERDAALVYNEYIIKNNLSKTLNSIT